MGTLSLITVACAPLLLFGVINRQHEVEAFEVIFADSDAGSSGDGGASARASADLAAVEARNTALMTKFRDDATLDDMMVIVCDGLQSLVSDCRSVPRFKDYAAKLGQDLNILPNPTDSAGRAGRRRRWSNSFANSWFGNSWDWPTNNNNFNNLNPYNNNNNNLNSYNKNNLNSYNNNNNNLNPYNNNFNTHNNNHTNPWSTNSNSYNTNQPIICPTQQNQSMVYQLNPDSSGYPASAIATELLNNRTLQGCLVQEVVLETDPPNLLVEDFRTTSNLTCPYMKLRLWQYNSQRESSSCWILQNYQEYILYRVCSEIFCRNCKDKHSTGFGYGSSSTTTNVKMCITDYQIVSVWAYCPSKAFGSRIVRERIIIPASCSCRSVRCEQVPNWKK